LARWLLSPGALQAIEHEQQRRDFSLWLKSVSPTWSWDWAHLHFIREKLELVTSGECKRLALFLPPRHGKSEQVTVRYPVWRLEKTPELKIIIGAYNQTLAESFSRKARRLALSRFALSTERATAGEWETADGGGVRAVGVGAGVTGHGGDLIVIDDPVKNREEANSEVYREHVWDWYRDDLYTRLEPDGSIVLIMTRWHEDDLAGRILNSENAGDWTVISLPAEAEADDQLGREEGEALCPERFDLDALADIKTTMGRSYWALYQQAPQPQSGEFFKREWFTFENPPANMDGAVRYWDKAASADGGDYTAGVLIGKRGRLYFVMDVVRGQWSTFEREEIILKTAHRDLQRIGPSLRIWLEQEPGSGGKDSAQMTIARLAGFTVRAERPTGDKATRAEPFAAQCEAGFVRMVKAPWNDAYLDELCGFPFGKFDDQVDASSGAFNNLVGKGQTFVFNY